LNPTVGVGPDTGLVAGAALAHWGKVNEPIRVFQLWPVVG